MNLILIMVSAAFVNNVVLSQFLGLCPFLGVSKRIKTSTGMGGAVIAVISVRTGTFRPDISEYYSIHPGYCFFSTVP
mgnify:CR=1 FL=1